MIPLVCALVIAVVSESSRGRELAMALAVVFIALGVIARLGGGSRQRWS
jgi:hypothetical protein